MMQLCQPEDVEGPYSDMICRKYNMYIKSDPEPVYQQQQGRMTTRLSQPPVANACSNQTSTMMYF
jgi:hypothetical protein